ncbi:MULTISPECIES: UvrD-helicase domain-containing protein [Microbacterium]|uniref:UvrD-helicase domain-containing protein n=1 Tax=Microbacterium TaxID=33882 RepID=UPI001EF736AF|nr:UvrD-helicase domain-containing protein [Microbacterium sp. ACRRU]MCG7417478.1 UvrD-helicase domain-containing protein [Microbacterium sp. ACRRU]
MSLEDDDARAEIRARLDENLFVDAGAGSGKTSALVGRVVASVMGEHPVPLAKTAVVTFTEKAGAELRDRLRAAFEKVRIDAHDRHTIRLAQEALDDLDAAAIGTLHSFAQRILAAFPIQAGMPPLVEVLDEVGSSVAFDDRWAVMWRRMLDDDALAEPLHLALAVGVKDEQLRFLARRFGNDWDLIESHVLNAADRGMVLPDTGSLARRATLVAEAASGCCDDSDLFLGVIRTVAGWVDRFSAATDDRERFALVRELSNLKLGRGGRSGNWPDLAGLKDEVKALTADAREVAGLYGDSALRPLARWIAAAVLDDARLRVASGGLEFHDLLVASRDLLRTSGDARAALQQTYPRLLLDEFQDTDPIQIELAVRIAGGRDADAADWRDVVLPPGSLFVVGDPKQSIYRFRRASISTYLDAGARLGRRLSLTTNFRTVPPVLDWVNAVFENIITEKPQAQPRYEALGAARTVTGDDGSALDGPTVTLLGAEPHPARTPVGPQREAEAVDVASVIRSALAEGWTVGEDYEELELDGSIAKKTRFRPLAARDIAILIPARTSLPFLEDALDAAAIPYRTESSSLVYQSNEIRSLLAAARAIADPSDQLSAVTALRSALFGCGDDDLFVYKRDGGAFTVSAPVPEALADTPTGRAMSYLNGLFRRSRWMTPAELLTALAVDRRVLEAASVTEPSSRARDQWGRVRFVIDQARAWADIEHGGLREYLAWAAHQSQDGARVAESLLPETDLDVVRIMTVHAAKGLEFGMVVLSGLSSHPNRQSGVRLLWGDDNTYSVSLTSSLQTTEFADAAPLDEQMDDEERRRLLYVGATRARDHLVVSLHRAERDAVSTAAEILTDAGAIDVPGVTVFRPGPSSAPEGARREPPGPGPSWDDWSAGTEAARAASRAPSAVTASGLEGTEPDVSWAIAEVAEDPVAAELVAGGAKGGRDVELAPWLKGRYGNLIGRAVHGTLQAVGGDPSLVDTVALAQALAEGIPLLASHVGSYVRSALATDVVQRAFASEHWSELYVGATDDDGMVNEGFIDLLFRDADGALVIVDYKTDKVTDAASLASRAGHYAPQLQAYARMLEAATGERARAELVFLDSGGDAGRVVPVPVG